MTLMIRFVREFSAARVATGFYLSENYRQLTSTRPIPHIAFWLPAEKNIVSLLAIHKRLCSLVLATQAQADTQPSSRAAPWPRTVPPAVAFNDKFRY
jgi:hypothetical protein